MKSKRVTLKDIAKHLNLSISTVSRALIDDKNIRSETKAIVIEAARELNYKRNPIGLSLKHGSTKTIGFIVPEMITPFAAQVVNSAQDKLNTEGYKIIIAQSDENPKKERDNLLLMENFMVDGIIICACDYKTNKNEYLRLQDNGMPIVFYDRIPHGLDFPCVLVDDYKESFFMVEHLIRKGRKRIVYIQGPKHIYNSIERAKGYKNALNKFNISLDPELIIETGMSFEDGRKAAQKLLNSGVEFDAIFSFTETLALGAMNCLKSFNIQIPNQVAVVSFSGTIYSTIVHPQLSSVEQPLNLMGVTAADLILEKIKNPNSSNKKIVLNSSFCIRASSD